MKSSNVIEVIGVGQVSYVDAFYDRHARVWTALAKDATGNQIGHACYGVTKQDAIDEVVFENNLSY
jgi:hypothetical protein